MLENVLMFLGILAAGVVLAAICFVIGAWVMFKGKAGPGEGFVRTPKGKAFTIVNEAEDFPVEENPDIAAIVAKAENLASRILGGGVK